MDILERVKKLAVHSGLVFVVSGPSGVGKDTLLARLEQVCPGIKRCVTYTTRRPRTGEAPGDDYTFVSEAEFQGMIERGEFLEYANVHGYLYGSRLKELDAVRGSGKDAILKIDVQGGLAVKRKLPEAIMVFIAPPSMDELERRLRARYTDTEMDIRRRCEDALHELEQAANYDYLVVNDEVESATDKLRSIVVAERLRIRKDG